MTSQNSSTLWERLTEPSKVISLGLFGSGEPLIPQACLHHCLDGRDSRASTHGCAMLKALVSADAERAACEIPAECTQGYQVRLLRGSEECPPGVLVLTPPSQLANVDEPLHLLMEKLQQITHDFARLNEENNGLAEEVLRGYEQLNLIFDISADIAILSDADEVRRLLLSKLRYLFAAEEVLLISQDGRSAFRLRDGGDIEHGFLLPPEEGTLAAPSPCLSGLPPEYDTVRRRLKHSQRVTVLGTTSGHDEMGRGTSMWGLLKEESHAQWIVGMVRRKRSFVAGDMLVLDSVLSYSGHILSNLRLIERLKQSSFEAVRALVNAIDQKDSYTCGHSERVGFLAKLTGKTLGLSSEQQQYLEWAGLLHDVGKIGIPEAVLNKPGPLNDEEQALIREHPRRSYQVLKPVAMLEPLLPAVLYHHENPDGSGYPEGLQRDEIPLAARIVHVVDVFDALTSSRSYRSAFQIDRAIALMKEDAGTKLDAEIVDLFLNIWNNLPMTHPNTYAKWFTASRESDHGT